MMKCIHALLQQCAKHCLLKLANTEDNSRDAVCMHVQISKITCIVEKLSSQTDFQIKIDEKFDQSFKYNKSLNPLNI